MIVELFCPSAIARSLDQVDLDDLQARGIDSVILDLDNTIVAWQRFDVPDSIIQWMSEARKRGIRLCIASNTRNTRRLDEIAGKLAVPSICRALKPRRKGFIEALKLMGNDAAHTAVIGDQILTDVLGGNRVGMYTILVAPMHRREFIGTKVSRIFEKLLIMWFCRKGLMGTKPLTSQSEREERP
ncbi:MAG: YqeG family HAD IIIA-type phosphatase [Armatimonadota bacterium]|nr:YqeG family HAD IIIA-type phosphatase [Armatimonadota bacterium]